MNLKLTQNNKLLKSTYYCTSTAIFELVQIIDPVQNLLNWSHYIFFKK